MVWLKKYLDDLSVVDKNSDSFRYPFHIRELKDGCGNKIYDLNLVFEERKDVDLLKFTNKFEAAYEIIKKCYLKNGDVDLWKEYQPVFIEEGGYYFEQSRVGDKYSKMDFYPYVSSYLETANTLKQYVENETDGVNNDCKSRLFMPMCYLYRNCVELSLKGILYEEVIEYNNSKKCEIMYKKKHSIIGLWNNLQEVIKEYCVKQEDIDYLDVVRDYCQQIQRIDDSADKFRYPMSKSMEVNFKQGKRFDFLHVGNFFEALCNILDCIKVEMNTVNCKNAEMLARQCGYDDYCDIEYLI